MARLVPKLKLSEIRNVSERKVATVLVQQLPDSNVVIHSFNWVRRESRTIIEGECDFVILDPNYGFLFVEVKGGIMKYLPDEDIWVRFLSGDDRTKEVNNPFEQVRRNMYAILKYVKSNLDCTDFPYTYGYAVMFPDGVFQGQLPASALREQIFDANTLNQMQIAVNRVFKLFHRKSRIDMSTQQFKRLRQALMPEFDIIPVLYRSIEDQEAMLHRATEDQKNSLRVLREHNIAAIRGGAGTGKTLLAIAKAQELAGKGIRTLLVCYNRALRDWLLEILSDDFGDLLSIYTYHSLADDFCKLAEIEFVGSFSEPDQKFWNEIAPDRLVQACDRLPSDQKFDAVVVDEGQDFPSLWWDSIEYVFRNPDQKSCYYVFFDPRQKFDRKNPVELPDEFGRPYSLDINCRNTSEIARHCATIINEEITTKADMPSGLPPQIHTEKGWPSAFQTAHRIAKELCRPDKHGLKFSQVVILTPGYAKKHWPNKAKETEIVDAINLWRNNKSILTASLHQFKGLEADAVILLTPTSPQSGRGNDTENYVACSRAKHVLHVIYVDE